MNFALWESSNYDVLTWKSPSLALEKFMSYSASDCNLNFLENFPKKLHL